MTNEFGVTMDRNGYVPSILQRGRRYISVSSHDGGGKRGIYDGGERAPGRCYLCGGREGYGLMERLERHEPWNGAANRSKSKALGMWVNLHRRCHEEAHTDAETGRQLRADAQRAAMLRYGWSREEFLARFGKSELSEDECARLIRKDAGRGDIEAAARGARMVGQSAGGFRVIVDGPEPPF